MSLYAGQKNGNFCASKISKKDYRALILQLKLPEYFTNTEGSLLYLQEMFS